LILNFLIAIFSDAYAAYIGTSYALKLIEFLKIRLTYEKHEHYHCLVKAPIVLNHYMVIMAPIIIMCKSRRLNKIMLFVQYFLFMFLFLLGLTSFIVIVIVPFMLLI